MHLSRFLVSVSRLQIQLMMQNTATLVPLLIMPLTSLIPLIIVLNAGRLDLISYVMTAALLTTIGQMGFEAGGWVVTTDREEGLMDLIIVSSASYWAILIIRMFLIITVGAIGFLEFWLLARYLFKVDLSIMSPNIFAISLILTLLAGAASATVASALLSLAASGKNIQSTLNGPFYLLGGVLVPIDYLPSWTTPISFLTYFYWSAVLIRAGISGSSFDETWPSLVGLITLTLIMTVISYIAVRHLIAALRQDGTWSIT
ncbi:MULTISPECIES: ABC transporter permease [Pseudomonas]|uniref:ABC transporter permease n=1 Tax=Pseudomonas putida TaxID=303 RepID=A0A7W2L0B5_PSEPU|nr:MULTISPECIES: ABC transporter permease [Pseudomonas]MBA6116147.1 ABC transporter permease [Pseudomonas putida]PZQ36376.1 MAG: hypothetical protein DI560_24995 [Pseudomonas putida]QNL86589.1 Uncharacterized protein PPKH_1175 [Pseudomonas putida]